MTRTTKTKPKPKTLTTAQIIAGAQLPRAEVPLCMRGDLVAKFQAAERAFNEALTAAGESLAGTPDDIAPLAEAVEAIRQEMQDYTLMLVMQGLPRKKYKDLEAAHPPRHDDDGAVHEEDRRFGVDVTTFFPALLPLSVIEPGDLTPELWNDLLGEDGKLTDGQIEELCTTAFNLNQGRVVVPFSPAVSKILQVFATR